MSEELQQRPTLNRAPAEPQGPVFPPQNEIDGVTPQQGVIVVLQHNPTFSFAEGKEFYEKHYVKPTPAEPVIEQPVRVADAVAEHSEPAPIPAVQHSLAMAPEVQQEAPCVLATQKVPGGEIVVEPAPVAKPAEQPRVEPAPVAQAPQPVKEAIPDLERDEQQPNLATEPRRKTNYGTSPHRPEISELPSDDPHGVYARTDQLVGTYNVLAGEEEVKRFFSGIKRGRNNQPLFESAEEEERYQRIFTALELTPPITSTGKAAFDLALERDDTSWSQTFTLPDGKSIGPAIDRGADAPGALAALRRRRKSGSPVSLWLPATGIFVGFRAPLEREMCDFDIRLTSEQSKVGMYTYGLLLASTSGVYLRHMIEHSLTFAVETTYDCDGNDIKTTLTDVVDLDDYWLLILGPIMAKFPAGIPWKLICPDACGYESEVRLNLARCIRMADGLFTDMQRALMQRQRGTTGQYITAEDYSKYRKELPVHPCSVFHHEDTGVTVTFGRSTIGEYIDSSEQWVEEVNRAATSALAEHSTEQERSQHIRLTAETRRLTRYAHHVKSIVVEEMVRSNGSLEPSQTEEKDPTKIVAMLEELSTDRLFVLAFEEALSRYNEMSRMAVFGYMSHACPKCHKPDGEKEGPFRGIVTISPDRLFFALSRVVSEIQKVYLQQFGSIG